MAMNPSEPVTKVNIFLYRTSSAKPLEDIIDAQGLRLSHDPTVDRLLPGEAVTEYLVHDKTHRGIDTYLVARHQNRAYFSREIVEEAGAQFNEAGVGVPDDMLAVFHRAHNARESSPLDQQEYMKIITALKNNGWDMLVTTGHGNYAGQLSQQPLYTTPVVRDLLAEASMTSR